MTRDEIIKEITETLDLDITEIKDEMKFKEDLGLDSIDMVEILTDMEEKHDIYINDEVATEIKTVGDFVKAVTQENR